MSKPDKYSTPKTQLINFFGTFKPTIELVDDLIKSKTHSQEIIILTCSRLDALATTSKKSSTLKMDAFVSFVSSYSQERKFFNKVSVGDLYRELLYHRYLVANEILFYDGRLHRYSKENEQMIRYIYDSGIPLTKVSIERLLNKTINTLSSNFRVKGGQDLRKSHLASIDELKSVIDDSLSHSRLKDYKDSILKAISPTLRAKTTARILYERFRSEVIHGVSIQIDEDRFFKEDSPYWSSWYTDDYGSFVIIEYPAKYLRKLLANCIETYKNHLIAKGVVPYGIHWLVFFPDADRYLDYIDETTFELDREPRMLL